ncbi:MAG: serine/threonine protein kinase [Nannocystaceae bacterium]|nr:serine/threonine protein kinase [Nannocystaceae bacterium]
MGSVYEAHDPRLKRKVALKIVDTATIQPAEVRAVMREARALARVEHPNVVAVYDAGECDVGVWVAMALLVGEDLRAWSNHPQVRPVSERRRVLLELGLGVAAIHRAGLVHRDIKPANAFVGRDGRVSLIDFGLALGIVASVSTGNDSASSPSPRTGTGTGTPAYMAPEQHRGGVARPQSDQFAWCTMAWETLFGQRPFDATSPDALYEAKMAFAVRPPPDGVQQSPQVRAVLARGLSPDPLDRWPSMDALLAAFSATESRRRLWLGVGAGAAGVGIAAALLWSANPVAPACPDAQLWDEVTRASVQAAVQGDRSTFRLQTWQRLEARLDKHVDVFEAARAETCRLAHIPGTDAGLADRRSFCLARWQDAFEVLIDTLHTIDDAAVALVIGWSMTLDDAAECAAIESTLVAKEPTPPRALQSEVAALRRRLARARVLRTLGRTEQAQQRLAGLRRAADAVVFEPFAAELEYETAKLLWQAGDWQTTEEKLVDVYHRAREAKHPFLEVRAAISMSEFLAGTRADPEAARPWLRRAQAVPLGDWPLVELSLLKVESVLLSFTDDDERAVALARLVVERSNAVDWDATGLHAIEEAVLVLVNSGHFSEAVVLARQREHEIREHLGAEHPLLAANLHNLAIAAWETGELEEANRALSESIALYRQHKGEDSVDVALGLLLYGMLNDEYDAAKAARALEEAAVRFETAVPKDHAAWMWLHLARGDAAVVLGEFDAALRYFASAEVLSGQFRTNADPAAWARAGTGRALLGQGKYVQARTILRKAWKDLIAAEKSPTPQRELGEVRFALARALWLSGGPADEAIAVARDARSIVTGTHPAAVAVTRRIDTWLRTHPNL